MWQFFYFASTFNIYFTVFCVHSLDREYSVFPMKICFNLGTFVCANFFCRTLLEKVKTSIEHSKLTLLLIALQGALCKPKGSMVRVKGVYYSYQVSICYADLFYMALGSGNFILAWYTAPRPGLFW
jgi:hypothetical protein